MNSIREATLLQAVINAIPAPIFFKDSVGRYLGCNGAFEVFVGRKKEEMIGRGVFELWDEELATVYQEADDALFKTGGEQLYEAQVTFADGSIHDVIFHKAVFHFKEGNESSIVGVMLDITERKKLEAELQESRELFVHAFHSNPGLIALTDPETGEHIDVNESWLNVLQFSREEVIGKTGYDLDIWTNILERKQILRELEKNGRVRDFEASLRAKDGTIICCSISSEPIKMSNRDLVLWTALDISARKEAEKELERLARSDPLTGLGNRYIFYHTMENACKRAKRHKTILAACAIDLDGFKQVNDCYGHPAGDELLVEVARRLKKAVRDSDVVARTGGDEFFIILEAVADIEDVKRIAEIVVRDIAVPYMVGRSEVRITASIGISIYGQDGVLPDELVKNADLALYEMKASGKKGYLFFNGEPVHVD